MNKEWIKMYNENKHKLISPVDLETYFTEKCIGDMQVDILEIGNINFPTGRIVACDPLVNLDNTKAFLQEVPKGSFPVKIAVVPHEKYGDRYACVKVEFSKNKPITYELAVMGDEEELNETEMYDYYGFGVDAGMGSICDIEAQKAYSKYWKELEKDGADNPFDDLFDDLLTENAEKNPKYQDEYGSWLNWTVPNTDLNIALFQSGWGDGVYPCYLGYDENRNICGFYVFFINIERDYKEDDSSGD